MAQEMLDVTVRGSLSGDQMFAEATDHHAYTGGKVAVDGDEWSVPNPVFSEGADDPEATSKFADFSLGQVEEGDVFVFVRHIDAPDMDLENVPLDGDETVFVEIRDGDAVQIDEEDAF